MRHDKQKSQTQLYGRTKYDIDQLASNIKARLDPWRVGFGEFAELNVERFDGRQIQYKGSSFEGSPRSVFWGGFIEPFLKDGIVKVLESTLRRCQDSGINARPHLEEAAVLLKQFIRGVYRFMAQVDYSLITSNHQLIANPPKVDMRDTSSYEERMNRFLDQQLSAVLAQTGPRYSLDRIKRWVLNHPVFGVVVLITVVVFAFLEVTVGILNLVRQIASSIGI